MTSLNTHHLAVDIIKRDGERPSETFIREKLHKSITAACLSVRSPKGQAESTASIVCDTVIVWLQTKPEVTSDDIRRVATQHLKVHHPDAAYIYENYRHAI